jgi:hypothetical protein
MQEGQKVNQLRVFYLVIAILFSGFLAFTPNEKNHFGFFAKLLLLILGSGLGYIGALVGDAVRKFALPDAVFTNGGIGQLIKTKLFWMIGPQFVGIVVGSFVGLGIIIAVFQ